MYGRSGVNVKVEPRSTLPLRAACHTSPLFYLRAKILHAYARKNYLTVEIHPNIDRR